MPMSATKTRPALEAPASPALGATSVTVASARTAVSTPVPVSASIPEGTSIATLGRPVPFMASMVGGGRIPKGQVDAGAKQTIDQDIGRWNDALGSAKDRDAQAPRRQRVTACEARRVTRGHDRGADDGPTRSQEAGRDQRVPAVIARAGDHNDAFIADAIREGVDEPRDLPACDLHQLERLDTECRQGLRVGLAQRDRGYRAHLVPTDHRPGHVTSSVSPGATCRRAAADPSRSANSMRPLLPTSATSSLG